VTADSTSFDKFARASANDRVVMYRILALSTAARKLRLDLTSQT